MANRLSPGGFPGAAKQISRAQYAAVQKAVRRHQIDVRRGLLARLKERRSLQREISRAGGDLHSPAARQKSAAQLAGPRAGIVQRMTKRNLAPPPAPAEIGGVLGPSFSVRLTPPYDYADLLAEPPQGATYATADRFAGQMTCGVSTLHVPGETLLLTAWATLGGFFFPPFGPAALTVRADPAYVFSWWAEQVEAEGIYLGYPESAALLQAGIVGFRGATAEQQADSFVWLWDEQLDPNIGEFFGLKFDAGSVPDQPVGAHLEVDTAHFYLVYVNCACWASAGGWQRSRSVAGGSLALTLPSISLDLRPILTIAPASAPLARKRKP